MNICRSIFVKMVGVKLKISTAYHPETYVQVEIMNCIIEEYLRFFEIIAKKTRICIYHPLSSGIALRYSKQQFSLHLK